MQCDYCKEFDNLISSFPENAFIYNYHRCLYCKCQKDTTTKQCCDNPEIMELEAVICINCGLVHDKLLWDNNVNFNDKEDNQVRSSYEVAGMQNYGLSTTMKGNQRLNRLNKHNYFVSHKQRIVYELYQQISAFENIPEKYINQAIQLFVNLTNLDNYHVKDAKRNIFKGQRRKGMIAVCIWLSFDYFQTPRNLEDICKLLEITKKIFYKELGRYNEIMKTSHNSIYTEDSIRNGYLNKLNIEYSLGKLIYHVIDIVRLQSLIKGKPKTIITSCIFWVLKMYEDNRLVNLPKVYSISFYTIKNNVEFLECQRDKIFMLLKNKFISNRYNKAIRNKNVFM